MDNAGKRPVSKETQVSGGGAVSKRQMILALFASSFGFSLDLYDLFLLLYVAPTIGKLFFLSNNPALSLAGAYAAFATSVIIRPLGAVIFGHVADKHGRKVTLVITLGGVGIVTTLMGALPTLSQIGIAAPIIFIIMRLLQGTFIGGVTSATHTIGTETCPPSWRGWASGVITGSGGGMGALFASFAFLIISHYFPGPSFDEWGWRVLFFTGLISALFSLIVFLKLAESPLFKEVKKIEKTAKAPVRILFSRKYIGNVFVNLLFVAGAASIYYLTSGYMPAFLAVVNKLPKNEIGKLLMWCSVAGSITPIICGQISQMWGRRKAFLGSAIVLAVVFSLAGYVTLSEEKSLGMIYFYAITIVAVGNMAYAPIVIFLNERFPTNIRASGTAICWNVGFAIGGMMPMAASAVSGNVANIPLTLNLFLFGAIALIIVGYFVTPETRGKLEL